MSSAPIRIVSAPTGHQCAPVEGGEALNRPCYELREGLVVLDEEIAKPRAAMNATGLPNRDPPMSRTGNTTVLAPVPAIRSVPCTRTPIAVSASTVSPSNVRSTATVPIEVSLG